MSGFDLPPVPEGHTRIFEDHTGRNWEDVPNDVLAESAKDPLMMILQEEIQKEMTREILERLAPLVDGGGLNLTNMTHEERMDALFADFMRTSALALNTSGE